MGNLILQGKFVRSPRSRESREELLRRLHAIGWRDRLPMLIGVWEVAALARPSAQVCLPQAEQGPPIIGVIFGRVLHGTNLSLTDATAIHLPVPFGRRLCREAFPITLLLSMHELFRTVGRSCQAICRSYSYII